MIQPQEPLFTFTVKGKCKSRIRCRSFASLKLKQIEENIIEGNEMTIGTPYEGLGDLEIPKKDEWVNVFIELNTLEPSIEIVLPYFEAEKRKLTALVKEFKDKISELKLDRIPKTNILKNAEMLFFDYNNQLVFINECIKELTT